MGAEYGDGPTRKSLASGLYTAFPSTPQHASTTIEVAGSFAILRKGEETRVFESSRDTAGGGNNYRLTHLGSNTGSFVALAYRNGLIRSIADADGPVFDLIRDGGGRITSIQDRWGREVHYRYDGGGKLSETEDIAGNAWAYEYAAHGQLTRAIGPNERDILRITYDGVARVRESLSGRKYVFDYFPDSTVVFEGTGHSHVFGHNAAGITNRFDSTNGVWWQLRLDNDNRVVAAFSSNGSYQYSYNANGTIARMAEQLTVGTKVNEFEYDDQGRITGVLAETGALTAVDYAGGSTRISGSEGEFAFDILPSGRIGEVWTDHLSVSADYDPANNLAAFRSGQGTVQFGRDEMGRVSDVRYADGKMNEYQYDELGNRNSVVFGLGGAVQYKHDPSGNIAEVVVTNPNGTQQKQVVEIGDMNRVESIHYEKAGRLDISYDRMGRAVQFKMDLETISVEYEGPSRIHRIKSMRTGTEWSPDDSRRQEQRTHPVQDARQGLFHRDFAGYPHANYGIVQFDEFGIAMFAGDPLETEIAGLRKARQLLAIAEPLLVNESRTDMLEFEKPSNPVFQPLEYRSTNCCVPIPTHPSSPTIPRAPTPGGGVPKPPGGGGTPLESWWCVPSYFDPTPQPGISFRTGPTAWYIDEHSSMPTITLSAKLSAVDTPIAVGLTYSWELEADYGRFGGSVSGTTESLSWTPSWGGQLFGGDVTIKVSTVVEGKKIEAERSGGYWILGENPTATQLGAEMGDPWFFAKLVRKESSCLQFNDYSHRQAGLPRTDGGGYGLTQITFRPNRDIVWDWLLNINEGITRLEEFERAAKGFWGSQERQWRRYNLDRRIRSMTEAGPPQDFPYSGVTFGYEGAGKKPLWQADWIQRYNGLGSAGRAFVVWENREWEAWAGMDPRPANEPRAYWNYNDTGYVGRVTAASPCP